MPSETISCLIEADYDQVSKKMRRAAYLRALYPPAGVGIKLQWEKAILARSPITAQTPYLYFLLQSGFWQSLYRQTKEMLMYSIYSSGREEGRIYLQSWRMTNHYLNFSLTILKSGED